MMFTPKTAGLALFSFALAARHAAAVEDCVTLISEVEAIASSGTVSIDADFSCSAEISIAASQTVTLVGPATISIGAGFSSTSSSLFVNDGTLTLQDLTFESEVTQGNRAVRNTGSLFVEGCTFHSLFGGGEITSALDEGGAIYSVSGGTVSVTDSTFSSNFVSSRGGAISAGETETVTILRSTFSNNEADSADDSASGGDIWVDINVSLNVTDSVFSGSAAEYGGAAIECCGGTITGSNFTSTDSSGETEHFGAVLVGRRGVGCSEGLVMSGCTFSGCTVGQETGAGGSLAIFDTSANIQSCFFQGSVGTAVLFESSSATGDHKLVMTSNEFNENTLPSELYQSSVVQGSAVVITNTGLEEGDDPVSMGEFFNMYCFANEPYECEFVFDLAEIAVDGEFKCHICDIDGVRQAVGIDDELSESTERSTDSSSDDNSGVVIGLSLALGLTLVVIGALAVWKFRVQKNARRLMEDMGDGEL